MPSIVPGFEYDIFISYRHNDNLDGWVTDFVQSLDKELKATIKEPLSIYFDKNPHDGLLENHDVDESLKEKLKCFIFIPIISQTYCDPKSFAWKNEFLVFKKLASKDSIGFKVKLQNGNVASRILPVRIHELDAEDQSLLENEIGSIRSIDFIFKARGVNRPLMQTDLRNENSIQTYYKDQANKLANAIKEAVNAFHTPARLGIAKPTSSAPFSGEKEAAEKSIIVLPFVNLSNDPEQEYFSDGLTDEIIADLSRLRNFLVISRSSAMTYKSTNKKVSEIASEVNVDYVLDGSVRRSGNNIRVTAELVDARSDAQLWAEKYNSTMDNVFHIQEQVSCSIVEALRVNLNAEEIKMIREHPIENLLAYECYLRARPEIYNITSEETLQRIVQLLTKGLENSPANELLLATMGFAYVMAAFYLQKNNNEFLSKGEDYCAKVFDINPDSSHGHFISGYILHLKGELQKAVSALKKSLTVDPGNGDATFWLCELYLLAGRPELARPLAKRLAELDPLTPINYCMPGWVDLLSGHFDGALEPYHTMYLKAPDQPFLRWSYGFILTYNNRLDQAVSFFDQNSRESPDFIGSYLGMFIKCALQKQKEKATLIFSEKIEHLAKSNVWWSWVATDGFSLLNEKESALTWLENSVILGNFNYPFLSKFDPHLENLRGDKRFETLMQNVKEKWKMFEA